MKCPSMYGGFGRFLNETNMILYICTLVFWRFLIEKHEKEILLPRGLIFELVNVDHIMYYGNPVPLMIIQVHMANDTREVFK